MDILEEEFQRQLKLSALFNSGGWLLFENELKEMRQFAVLELENLLRQPIQPEELGKLNLAIARRHALDSIFGKIAILQEELEGSVNSPVEA
jgi:hypothetical protein